MGTSNTFKTDLYHLYDYVQNTQVSYPKQLFIETLRNFFSEGSYYHYSRDAWGFPNTPDHTGLPRDAGLYDDETTRLFIGEYFRFDVAYYPGLYIKSNGANYVPISMSRNRGVVEWKNIRYVDGYGNEKLVSTPSFFVRSGAWEGSVTVDVITRSLRSRDEIVELVSLLFVDLRHQEMIDSGVVIKQVSVGGPSESEDRNDKLFRQSITFDIRSEWRRKIPVDSVINIINICVDIGNVESEPPRYAENMQINTTVELLDALSDL
jgi:hypothetical protein